MVEFRQDMPPAGGYSPITYKRVPLRKGLGGIAFLSFGCAFTAFGFYQINCFREECNIEKIEMRCAKIALQPMLEAENDRMILKQLKRNRDAEERIMKDVKGWEVGKWKKSPVYLTLGPDDYFKPIVDEYIAHADKKPYKKASAVLKEH